MTKSTNPKRAAQVDAYDHDETRPNIPTADAAATFYDDEKDALPPLRYPRDTSLDPQLLWRGKDEQDGEDLVVDAPPIYIQEKVIPRALIENLRVSAKPGEREPEVALFELFDGLDGLSQVEFYQHEESWKNRLILGDSLQVMGSLAEREALRGKAQMIYIDPPYGIKFGSNWQVRTSKRDVKDGRLQDAAREAEQIRAFRDTWELGIHSYLSYLRDRLILSRDLLAESGSVFVQIGYDNVHLVRNLLDEIFGSSNFVSQITVKKTSGAGSPSGGTDVLASVSDYILWFAKNKESIKYRQLFRQKEIGGAGGGQYTWIEDEDGSVRSATTDELAGSQYQHRIFSQNPLTSQSSGGPQFFDFEFEGKIYSPGTSGWKTTRTGMERLRQANRLMAIGKNIRYKRFFDDFPVFPNSNLWEDTVTSGFGDPKIYVVQTNTKIVQRCILMATDPGDLVIDPTCGSGTTAYVAEYWGRRWITVDTSRVALALARQRIMGAKFPNFLLLDSDKGRQVEGLPPGIVSNDLRQGFVLKKVQHITLKSIANNPDIREGLSGAEVEAAVRRHADFENIVDSPIEDKSKTRVSGPFTVESLSPHRSLSLDETGQGNRSESSKDSSSFETSIFANLQTAGIQNGRRNERLQFSTLESYSGRFIQAFGNVSGSASPIAISIGPQYGTVSAGFIKNAAREAVEAEVPIVAVLGFAFDPQLGVETDEDGFAVVAGVRDLGKVKVLVVRMNVDLLMGEELKKTGAGNLFTVFGEPDLELRRHDDKWVVEVRGVDVYDPTSGQVRSNSTKEIALWMVDSNYDGESFFVRHAYFLGDNDPYKSLKTALKADIDPGAWATLYRAESVPFDTPETGRIAVKVINDYGDEVMKILEVG